MATRRALLAHNGIANVVRAGASSAVGVFLPLVLLSLLTNASYAAWALIFSIASYVMFFDIGMPATVQALVAQANERNKPELVRRASSSGAWVSAFVGALFIVATVCISWALPSISPDMSPAVRAPASAALIILSVGQAANLVSNTVAAHFAGLQRSSVPAAVVAPARVASLAAAAAAAALAAPLPVIATAYTLPCLVALAALVSKLLWETRSARESESTREPRYTIRGLLKFSGPMVLWSATMLASTGLGTLIVGRFAYEDLVAYSLGQVIYSAMYGLIAAIGSPLLPELTRSAVAHPESMGEKIIAATRVHSALLFAVSGIVMSAIPVYLMYLGGGVEGAGAISVALVFAATLHLTASPLSMGFIATSTHGRLILSPVLQATFTVASAIALVGPLGGFGVALGMVIGSVAGVVITCFQAVPRTRIGGLRAVDAANWALFIPLAGLTASAACVAVTLVAGLPPLGLGILPSAAGILITVVWSVAVVTPRRERDLVMSRIRSRRVTRSRRAENEPRG